MKNQLILARNPSGLVALFANQVLIAATSHPAQPRSVSTTALVEAANNLSVALATPVVTCEAPALAAGETWADLYARLPPVQAAIEREDFVGYIWSEGGKEPDTQYGPGDVQDDLMFDMSPPEAGVPYTVMVPLHHVDDTNRTSTWQPVGHWKSYGNNGQLDTHDFLIDDRRRMAGQATMELTAFAPTVGLEPLKEVEPESLSVSMEVTTDPLDGAAAVPRALVRDTNGEVKLSIVSIGGRLLLQPESQVALTGTLVGPTGKRETAYWVG